jgi:hypothetical protein
MNSGGNKEQNSTNELEQILAEAPYLNTYINGDLKKFNPEQWQKDMQTHGDPILKYFEKKYGENQFNAILFSHTIAASSLKIFDSRVNIQLKIDTTKSLLMIGFEINDAKKVRPILKPLIRRHLEDAVVNRDPKSMSPESIAGWYSGILRAGMVLRWGDDDRRDDDNPQMEPPDGGIEKILAGVDLSGLETI